MSEIKSYLEKLKIKEVIIGGFDKEAVYSSMQELASMYQKETNQYKEEKERLEIDYKKVVNELEAAKKEIQLLKYQLDEEQKSHNKYDIRFNALTQAVDAINASKEKIIEEANRKADEIITGANEKLARISQECLTQKQKKDLLILKMDDVKQGFNSSIDNVHYALTNMLIEVEALQKDGLDWQQARST